MYCKYILSETERKGYILEIERTKSKQRSGIETEKDLRIRKELHMTMHPPAEITDWFNNNGRKWNSRKKSE